MKVSIIGNGNVGRALQRGLQKSGHEVQAVGNEPDLVYEAAFRRTRSFWRSPSAATDFSDPALLAVEAGAAEARRRKVDLTIIQAVDPLLVMSPFYGEFYNSTPPIDLSDQMRKIWQQRLDECVHQFKAKGGGLLPDGPVAPAILSADLNNERPDSGIPTCIPVTALDIAHYRDLHPTAKSRKRFRTDSKSSHGTDLGWYH